MFIAIIPSYSFAPLGAKCNAPRVHRAPLERITIKITSGYKHLAPPEHRGDRRKLHSNLIRVATCLARVPQFGSSCGRKNSRGGFAFLARLPSTSIGAWQHVERVGDVFDDRATDRCVAGGVACQERVVTEIVYVSRNTVGTTEYVIDGFR